MDSPNVTRAKRWFEQAESDVRVAKALVERPNPMIPDDVGCHVTALCAQAVEKSIKGYVILNRQEPKDTHRADKYLYPLLAGKLLRYEEHRTRLSRVFDISTKAAVKRLLDLTPGATPSKIAPNTEYPWPKGNRWQAPTGAAEFSSLKELTAWIKAARCVTSELHKLCVEVGLRP